MVEMLFRGVRLIVAAVLIAPFSSEPYVLVRKAKQIADKHIWFGGGPCVVMIVLALVIGCAFGFLFGSFIESRVNPPRPTPREDGFASMPLDLRQQAVYHGYRHFVVFPNGCPKDEEWWRTTSAWLDNNLPKRTVYGEDNNGASYPRQTVAYYLTRDGFVEGSDAYWGFVTRRERDMFLAAQPLAVKVRDE